jgi:light-harvesting complex I chlorophyll a/b binding protein 1
MRAVTAVALHALIARVSCQDLLVDKLTDHLIDLDEADLDDTTLATAASPMTRVHAIQNKLKGFGVPSTPMQELALTAMVATRDVRAQAQIPHVFSTLDSASKKIVTKATQEIELKVEEMAGVSPPLGFWDPFGFTTKIQGLTILYLKEAEIKHGRVCMLAFLGIIAGEKYHPFLGGNIDLPAAKVKEMFLNTGFADFWLGALVGLGALEVTSIRTQYDDPFWEFDMTNANDHLPATGNAASQLSKQNRLPGELGFDPLGLKPKDPAELKTIQTKEINNGRLAMLAVAGILMQELVTQQRTFT